MERTSKKRRLSSQEVHGCLYRTLNIDDLPDEIFIKIFGYLKYEELCRVGWVSKKWHAIARYPDFWRRVDVHFSKQCGSMAEAAIKFIQILPPCVTHLRLSFEYSKDWILDLTELSMKLHDRCPNLQVLIFHRVRLTAADNPCRVHLSEQLISNIHVLALHRSVSRDFITLCSEDTVASKIEVLDISRSKISFDNFFVSKIPHLKKMHLAGSGITDLIFRTDPSIVSRLEVLDLEGTVAGPAAFQAVCNFGLNIVELYMCCTLLNIDGLVFNENALPRLEKLCVRGTDVTYKGVNSLLKVCKSLQHVYVGNLRADPDDDDYSLCNSEKVRVIHGCEYCDHYTQIDYMHM